MEGSHAGMQQRGAQLGLMEQSCVWDLMEQSPISGLVEESPVGVQWSGAVLGFDVGELLGFSEAKLSLGYDGGEPCLGPVVWSPIWIP